MPDISRVSTWTTPSNQPFLNSRTVLVLDQVEKLDETVTEVEDPEYIVQAMLVAPLEGSEVTLKITKSPVEELRTLK